jgi:hypothetical protein
VKLARAVPVLVAAFLLFIAVVAFRELPRYDWQPSKQYNDGLLRIDRWTGEVQVGVVDPKWGRWVSVWELQTDARAKASRLDLSTFASDLDRALDASKAGPSATWRSSTSFLVAGSLLLVVLGAWCGWTVRGTSSETPLVVRSTKFDSTLRVVTGVLTGTAALAVLSIAAARGVLPHSVAVALDSALDTLFTIALVGILVYAGIRLHTSTIARQKQ